MMIRSFLWICLVCVVCLCAAQEGPAIPVPAAMMANANQPADPKTLTVPGYPFQVPAGIPDSAKAQMLAEMAPEGYVAASALSGGRPLWELPTLAEQDIARGNIADSQMAPDTSEMEMLQLAATAAAASDSSEAQHASASEHHPQSIPSPRSTPIRGSAPPLPTPGVWVFVPRPQLTAAPVAPHHPRRLSVAAHAEMAMSRAAAAAMAKANSRASASSRSMARAASTASSSATSRAKAYSRAAAAAGAGVRAQALAQTAEGHVLPPQTVYPTPDPLIEVGDSYPNPTLPWNYPKGARFQGFNTMGDPNYYEHWLKWSYYQRNLPQYALGQVPSSTYSSTYYDPYA